MPIPTVKYFPYAYIGGGQIVGRDGQPVAYLAGRMNDGNADAVGRILAAAPEMFEALERARRAIVAIDKALSKARDEQ